MQKKILLIVISLVVIVVVYQTIIQFDVQENRDQIVAEGVIIASLAREHYNKLTEEEGAGTFVGFEIPVNYKTTENGTYSVKIIDTENIIIHCTGKETGGDQLNPVSASITISPTKFDYKILN